MEDESNSSKGQSPLRKLHLATTPPFMKTIVSLLLLGELVTYTYHEPEEPQEHMCLISTVLLPFHLIHLTKCSLLYRISG